MGIAPFKSASGRIMHVEHTHMPWANRFQNYEAHLITPGKLDAAGISWFGSPFFLDGLNDKITWSATWNEPNMADVYEEKSTPKTNCNTFTRGSGATSLGWSRFKNVLTPSILGTNYTVQSGLQGFDETSARFPGFRASTSATTRASMVLTGIL